MSAQLSIIRTPRVDRCHSSGRDNLLEFLPAVDSSNSERWRQIAVQLTRIIDASAGVRHSFLSSDQRCSVNGHPYRPISPTIRRHTRQLASAEEEYDYAYDYAALMDRTTLSYVHQCNERRKPPLDRLRADRYMSTQSCLQVLLDAFADLRAAFGENLYSFLLNCNLMSLVPS